MQRRRSTMCSGGNEHALEFPASIVMESGIAVPMNRVVMNPPSMNSNARYAGPSDASAAEDSPPIDLRLADGGNESLHHDRRFSTLNIADHGVRETSAADFLLGPPMRVVRAIQEFDAWRALPVFLLAGFCLTSLDTTAKYLVQDHSLFLVVWARYVGQMLIVAPFAWHRCGSGFWRTRRLPLQLLRSAMLLGATVCFFGGLRYLPLAEGSAILFLAPVFIVMLSRTVSGRASDARALDRVAHGFRRCADPVAAGIGDPPSRGIADVRSGSVQRVLPHAHPEARRRGRVHNIVLQRARRHHRPHRHAAVGRRRPAFHLPGRRVVSSARIARRTRSLVS